MAILTESAVSFLGLGFPLEYPTWGRLLNEAKDRISLNIWLVLGPGRADIIDYKSNRLGDDTAYRTELIEHYRPQLEAYRRVIAALYPEREVHAWLLFTDPVAGDNPLTEVL